MGRFTLRSFHVFSWRYGVFVLVGAMASCVVLAWYVFRMVPNAARKSAPSLAEVTAIAHVRCAGCHAEKPNIMPVAQMGVMLETPEQVKQHAVRIYERSVRLKNMPLANMTRMTEAERAKIAAWFAAGAQ